MDIFEDVMTALGKCNDVKQIRQAKKKKEFLEIVMQRVDSPLFVYALFNETQTTYVAAHFFLRMPYLGSQSFFSDEHQSIINLVAFSTFLKEKCATTCLQKVLETPFVRNSGAEISMIKQRLNMWEERQDNLPLGRFREKFKKEKGGLGSNAQCTKRGVKESNYVTLGNRKECTCYITALACGNMVEEVGITICKRKREDKEKKTGEDCSNESFQIQNKTKSKQMIEELYKQECKLQKIEERNGPQTYQRARTALRVRSRTTLSNLKSSGLRKKLCLRRQL